MKQRNEENDLEQEKLIPMIGETHQPAKHFQSEMDRHLPMFQFMAVLSLPVLLVGIRCMLPSRITSDPSECPHLEA
jgi:hypothetical protein